MRPVRRLAGLATAALLASGCGGAPILANPPLTFPSPAPPSAPPAVPPDPIPLTFPRDDGPHQRLTEWWYYTGHLFTAEGRPFGFEAVVFRAQRSSVPTAWASHLALTDEQGGTFHYAQRGEIGPQVDHSPRDRSGTPIAGFDLRVAGVSPTTVDDPPVTPAPWRLLGSDGIDRITAALTPAEAEAAGASFGLDLRLSGSAGPVAHDDDGFVDFGPAGSSYYYSRMRMEISGTLDLSGEHLGVEGTAWFDHQWGDFISVGGGWDWFAINLAGEIPQGVDPQVQAPMDITLSVVRDADGQPILLYGTLHDYGKEPVRLDASDFEVETLGSWTSPRSGRTWPSGWRVTIGDLVIDLQPTVDDQELDTRATTGVVYWEGSQVVTATRSGVPVEGLAYVEITRYAE